MLMLSAAIDALWRHAYEHSCYAVIMLTLMLYDIRARARYATLMIIVADELVFCHIIRHDAATPPRC